ncbi:PE family protein [Mycobacterium terramassiliense]|uniref:PE family protein n=1 Tax=Mycobacterium terramassiliense TaxID=1841859 RepID=A0A2U3N6W5_9MYCO|nr:PE family protein [Mycobacterium terramassiliense]SPM27246.1 PE family protein [Mycobacterium terramassiliense]
MSFVTTEPQEVQAAARNLAGIRSMLAESSASAAAPTAGVVAAAEDQVSAQVAALFSAFGQDYQVISARAQEFHEQFVELLSAGGGAYLSADVANAEQSLLNAGGRAGVVGALGSGTPGGQSIGAAVTALLAPAAGTGLASIGGPYQALFQHTAANLQILGDARLANPAPFVHQVLANQAGYARTIAAAAEYVVQNFPAVLAGLPADARAFVQALLAFNPVPYVQQFVANQMAYAQIAATSLQNAAHDFGAGLQALPTAFQSAVQALQTGDIAGAVADVAQGFVGLLAPGLDVTTTGNIGVAPGLIAALTPTGVVGDLLPLLTIPGMMAQNLTDLLPSGSIPALIAQNFTNVLDSVTDTSLAAQVLFTTTVIPRPPFLSANLSVSLAAGLPAALTLDAVGAPYNAANAFGSTVTTVVDEVQTGNFSGAIGTLIDGPAAVTDAFLNGQSTVPIDFDVNGMPAVVNLPLNGILVPPAAYTASLNTGIPVIGTITVPVGGTPLSGLATGLLIFAPEQLAAVIAPAG